jgi:hypothetical protein
MVHRPRSTSSHWIFSSSPRLGDANAISMQYSVRLIRLRSILATVAGFAFACTGATMFQSRRENCSGVRSVVRGSYFALNIGTTFPITP